MFSDNEQKCKLTADKSQRDAVLRVDKEKGVIRRGERIPVFKGYLIKIIMKNQFCKNNINML